MNMRLGHVSTIVIACAAGTAQSQDCLWQVNAASGSPVFGGPACYDSTRQRVVMCSDYLVFRTWEFDGATWILRDINTPGYRVLSRLAYDSGRQRTVLFGCFNSSSPPPYP
jgi:hypothetical protein